MSRIPQFLLAPVIGAAIVACACSSGGSNKTATPSSGSTPASGGNAATVSPELTDISNKFSASSFKGDYKLTTTGSDSPLDGTMTLYKDGPKNLRFDVRSNQDGQDVKITLIDTADVSAFCLDNAGELGSLLGVDANQGVCFKNDPTNGSGGIGDLTSAFKELSSGDTEVLERSTRQIIGQDAQCYHYKNNSTNETSDTCFSKDGVPLYDKTDSGSETTTVEATAINSGVQSSDFKLPYEVKDLPDLGGDSTDTP
jgi:hypothetical protein